MRKHVLLVAEDDSVDAMLIERAVRRAGKAFHLVRVADGDELIRYVEGTGEFADRTAHPSPELVLLDLKMPRRDGFAVLRWRQNTAAAASLPVVVLSSSSLGEDIERAYALGANSYVTKPTGGQRLEGMVHSLYDWWIGYNQSVPSLL